MLFNSLSFAVFLPVVFALYWIMPNRKRWLVLLLSSCYFYMCWSVKYILLILFTTFFSYICAIVLEKQKEQRKKRRVVVLELMISLGILFCFKYFNFVSNSISDVLSMFAIKMSSVELKLILPVGISFYTFQTLGYVIDVYRGEVKAERHFGRYAAFIAFFPQRVAGPIERTKNLMPQIYGGGVNFKYERAAYGLRFMAWGYFKKIVVADTLAVLVDAVFGSPQTYHGIILLVAVLMFTVQIYCDFSGYSDIAIGTAKLFGIDLMQNFNSPYFASSIRDFWARWHISLTSWFRDYLYIPLGGNRVSTSRNVFNVMVTFLASGLWHGANWTYVIWGGLHGTAQVIQNLLFHNKSKKRKRESSLGFSTIFVFGFTAFAWTFFRAECVDDAFYIVTHLFQGIGQPVQYLKEITLYPGINKLTLLSMAISLLFLFLYDYFSLKTNVLECIAEKGCFIRWCIYVFFILFIIFNIPPVSGQEFIYFQF